jgi:hypothetical protein
MPCYLRKARLGIVFARVGSNPAGDVSFALFGKSPNDVKLYGNIRDVIFWWLRDIHLFIKN